MGIVTAAVAIGAAAVGAATIKQARSAKKARQSAEADMRRQEKAARGAAAAKASALDPLTDTGAEIELGVDERNSDTTSRRRKAKAKSSAQGTPAKTGGLGTASSSMLGTALFGEQ